MDNPYCPRDNSIIVYIYKVTNIYNAEVDKTTYIKMAYDKPSYQ